MEVGTGLALFGAAKLVEKILGPTAEYIGMSAETWAKKRVENFQRILLLAQQKLGSRIDAPGQVPPKVLRTLLDTGSYSDDPLAAEYFAGVLASSRTTTHRDDRGAAHATLVDRLSAYQLRTHYLIYSAIAKLYYGTERDPMIGTGKLVIYIPYADYCQAMAFEGDESTRDFVLMTQSFYGLEANKLVGEWYGGQTDHLAKRTEGSCLIHKFEFPSEGIVVEPSVVGFQFFAWAHGMGDILPAELVSRGNSLPMLASMSPLVAASRLTDFQRTVAP